VTARSPRTALERVPVRLGAFALLLCVVFGGAYLLGVAVLG
jgi:hypothetical protein